MNETYVECLVARKKSAISSVIKFVLYGCAIACVLMALLGVGIMLLLGIVFGAVAYFVTPMFDIEYEYLYLDREITIDKVIAKQRRKRVITIDCNKVEIMAPSKSHSLDSYNNRQCAVRDFTSGDENANSFTLVYPDKEQLTLVKIEPNDEMIRAIKNVYPRKVVEY